MLGEEQLPKTKSGFERYVDRDELAEIMGVSRRQITKWVAAGMPSETWGLRRRWFLPRDAMQWARERTR